MTKKENIEDPNSCWNKAADDEPVFILRARDIIAPNAVLAWARDIEKYYTAISDEIPRAVQDKIHSAWDVATDMRRWPGRKVPD